MKRGVLFIGFGLGGVDQHRSGIWMFSFLCSSFGKDIWDILYGWLISLGLFLCIDLFPFWHWHWRVHSLLILTI